MIALTEKEKKAWDEQGWTSEGVAHVSVKDFADALGVPIGRAAAIKASCVAGAPTADEVERALGGDVEVRSQLNGRLRGLPWVVMRSGRPDLVETRALVKDLKERPARRSTWKGLLVVAVDNIAQAASKLPRCPITGNVLDDFDGKLLDGATGADWGPTWLERGNGRVLWVALVPTSALPAYALTDPARAAFELAGKEVPVQWQRVQVLAEQASSVEKAQAEERLFKAPEVVACAPASGDSSLITPQSGKALYIGYSPDDHRAAKMLQTHLSPVICGGTLYLVDDIDRADVVAILISPSLFADESGYEMVAAASRRRAAGLSVVIPVIVRTVAQLPIQLSGLRPLPSDGKPADGDADWAEVAAGLRAVAATQVSRPSLNRIDLRRHLERMNDSDFMAFCLDNFRTVFQRFGGGMDKTSKITLLLQLVDPSQIAAALS